MTLCSFIRSHDIQPFPIPADYGSFALKQEFNSLFGEARAVDRAINPHPMARMPVEIVREIFEAAARVDPDATPLLAIICMAWKKLVIETPKLWSDIRIDVDNDDMLESLHLSLLLSKNWPLDIAITGVCASDGIINSLIPHVHRIRGLELSLYREARVPFRVLGGAPPDGLSSLCRLAIQSASYNENSSVPSNRSLERASNNQNTINETDLFLIKSLPLLSSLIALVLHAPGVANMDHVQLPRVESLRLVMKYTPMVLECLTCNNLKNLDVVLDETSREGWWDLLAKSLTYPHLESLALDVTLDRVKNEWSKPWDSREYKRLATQPNIECLVVALSFSDREYRSAARYEENVEYLCGDLLQELTESVPSLKGLRLLHVPFLHAPFIWPSPEVLCNLRRLELQVPASVTDEYIPVIELPNLRDLRYYGYVDAQITQLPRLRTPSLVYLEIMDDGEAIHPILYRMDRYWPKKSRELISHAKYSKSRNNTSKDFPAQELIMINPQRPEWFLPVIHQSVALRELRLHLGSIPYELQFPFAHFPELRALHCSAFIFMRIDAPRLEELHLLCPGSGESDDFNLLPSSKRVQIMSRGLITLDIYSHLDPRVHGGDNGDDMEISEWMLHFHSLQTLILGFEFIGGVIDCLWKTPTLCPKLTMIDSFGYPRQWSSLRDCIEKRNHLAMQDPSLHPIRTLCFPLALHRNISDRLKESLSGEFAGPFVDIPLQPYALLDFQPDDERVGECCYGCVRSGNAFGCLGIEMKVWLNPSDLKLGCAHHWNRGPERGVTITANNMQLSGYLTVHEPQCA